MRVGQKPAGEVVGATVAAAPPVMEYDPVSEIVTIDGYRFTRALFSYITTSPVGVWLKIIERKDGVITFSQKREPLEVAAPDLLAALKEAIEYAEVVAASEGMPLGKKVSRVDIKDVSFIGGGIRQATFDVNKARKAIALAERGA